MSYSFLFFGLNRSITLLGR